MVVVSAAPAIVRPDAFVMVNAYIQMPARAVFNNVSATGAMPSIVAPDAFTGARIIPTIEPYQPHLRGEVGFEGAAGVGVVQQKAGFVGAGASAGLPESVSFIGARAYFRTETGGAGMNFDNMGGVQQIGMTFPDGMKITPTYGTGVPLGSEKPLLDPKLRKETK